MKIAIKTWGCTASQSDSEIMAGLLAEAGHQVVNSDDADVVIANTCTVKHRVEVEELKTINKLKSKNKKIIATGCLVQDKAHLAKLNGVSLVGLNEQNEIAKYVREVAAGKILKTISDKKLDKSNLPRLRTNPILEKIQIASGCASDCNFCATKLAKGDIYSFSEPRILAQIKSALADGCKELWLTSQDNGAYGLDRKTNITNLLQKICSIDGKFFIRNGMANPQWIKKFQKELIEVYKNPKVFKFLHIPIQSGSNKILKDMKRGYTIKQFKEVVEKFREEVPDLTISTDVICGFPTENNEDFEQTLELIKGLQPDIINISQFWPRPGTRAAGMKQLKPGVAKERSRKLTELYKEIALEKNKGWIGWQGEVLIDEIGTKGSFVARNFAYKPIVLKEGNLKLGAFVQVKVVDATKNYLIGKFL